jgi:hypothetical protein
MKLRLTRQYVKGLIDSLQRTFLKFNRHRICPCRRVALTSVEGAQAHSARYERLVAQNVKTLTLAVGTAITEPVPAKLSYSGSIGSIPESLTSESCNAGPMFLKPSIPDVC